MRILSKRWVCKQPSSPPLKRQAASLKDFFPVPLLNDVRGIPTPTHLQKLWHHPQYQLQHFSSSSALTAAGQARIQQRNEGFGTNAARADDVHITVKEGSAVTVPAKDVSVLPRGTSSLNL